MSSCSNILKMNPSQRSLADTKLRHLGEARKKDEADFEQAEIQKRAYDDYKTSILKACLEPGAFERLRRVALVKPEKANAAEACLLNMCQRVGPTTKIDENTVISILEKVSVPSDVAKTSGSIKFCRKRNYDSDDDI